MKLFEMLKTTLEFSEFDDKELAILSQAIVVNEYQDGHVFIKEGEKGDSLFFLIEGTVLVTRSTGIKKVNDYVERLRTGSMFGLISLIDHGSRVATCSADGEVTIGSLPGSAFDLLCNANAGLAQKFQFVIARQLAKDTRVYNQALSKIITTGDHSSFYGALMAASYEYRGIERRKQERRISTDRREGEEIQAKAP